MASADLSKLRIDRSIKPTARRRLPIKSIIAALVVAAGIGWRAMNPPPPEVQSTAVVATRASQQYVLLNATGYVVAQRKAAVSSKATGRLEWLGVAEGSRVKANDVIARLDARDLAAAVDTANANVKVARAAIMQAEAEARDAEASYRRNVDLEKKGFVAQAIVDQALARHQRAQAAVSSAKSALAASEANARQAAVSLDFSVIRAPFDGVILSKSANVGDIVTPFSSAADSKGAVVTMADMSTLEVEADVSEESFGKIKVGQPCEIVLDAIPDTRFLGKISRTVPTVDRAKATVMTKIQFSQLDPRILPEMSAKVSFLTREVTAEDQKPLVGINPAAVVQRDGKNVVFLIKDNKAVMVPVSTGAKIGDLVTLTADPKLLAVGDRAINKPDEAIHDGSPVKLTTPGK